MSKVSPQTEPQKGYRSKLSGERKNNPQPKQSTDNECGIHPQCDKDLFVLENSNRSFDVGEVGFVASDYLIANPDLWWTIKEEEAKHHYETIGRSNHRPCKLPFVATFYKELYGTRRYEWTEYEAEQDWRSSAGRKFGSLNEVLFRFGFRTATWLVNFDADFYIKTSLPRTNLENPTQALVHFITIGINSLLPISNAVQIDPIIVRETIGSALLQSLPDAILYRYWLDNMLVKFIHDGSFPPNADQISLKKFRDDLKNSGQTWTRFLEDIAPSSLVESDTASITIDSLFCSKDGTVFIVGWTDDRDCSLISLSIICAGALRSTSCLGRFKRRDVEIALGSEIEHPFGFWSIFKLYDPIHAGSLIVDGRRADGRFGRAEKGVTILTESDLLSKILGHFGSTQYTDTQYVEAFLALESGIGKHVIDLNLRKTASVIAGAWVAYYGPIRKSYKGSVVFCLFGKLEFMFLQSALFCLGARAAEYEFIYVANSPEFTEILQKEAYISAKIYGISITLICLTDNAGVSASNNIAARFARSNRLLITNPGIFPRDNDWVERHGNIIENAPTDQTLIFGAPLYYDNGSVMHHGIYFEIDSTVSVRNTRIYEGSTIRIEHQGKGMPAWSGNFSYPRPVPAVTGAFMSLDRNWFLKLGGFSEDFVFGQYEDTDLCLKSLVRGKPVWLHDLPLWHLDSNGLPRDDAHRGGSLINRWLFTRKWSELIGNDLLGPNPALGAFSKTQKLYASRYQGG